MTESATPVVFVHGLWLHHTSWNPWLELFAERGYAPVAQSAEAAASEAAECRFESCLDHSRSLVIALWSFT